MDKKIKFLSFMIPVIIAALVGVDQISKYFAKLYLSDTPDGVSVINGVFSFVYKPNTGISFSMLEGRMAIIIIITGVILAIMTYVLAITPKVVYFAPFLITLSVVYAGALGNMIDRIFRGYVIDFINPDFINFAIFNIADIFVCIGLFVMIILVFFRYKDNDFEFVYKKGKRSGKNKN